MQKKFQKVSRNFVEAGENDEDGIVKKGEIMKSTIIFYIAQN